MPPPRARGSAPRPRRAARRASPSAAGPATELAPEDARLDLVGGVPRQRGDELDPPRLLEAGESLTGERREPVAVDRGARARHDDRGHLLAPLRMRRPDDGDVRDVG